MGATHAAGWANTPVDIAGFVTKDLPSGELLVEKYGGRIFEDLAAMLEEVDVLDVCAPTHRHYEIVLAGAAAGVDILCEKPLARTVSQAQEMIVACESAGVKLMVAHVVRFFPEYAAARAQVASGAIGRPAVVRLRRGSFQPKKAMDNWFLDQKKSGGVTLDLMIHDLDYARWVAGDVVRVYAKKISSSHTGARTDHGLAILTHQSGAISHVEGSWSYPEPMFRTALEIAGDNGWIQFDSGQTAAIGWHLHQTGQTAPGVALPGSPLLEDPYTTEIKAFYDCLANDAPIPVSGVDGLAALQIALAAIESAETGQAIELSPLTKSG
jgi:predicted dehydrogenase